MNNKDMIQYEIIELNKRFINICLRVDESYLLELSVQLNTSMSVLRMIRTLNYEQIENLVEEARFFLQPAIDVKGLQKAAGINSAEIRRLFISSSIRPKNAS